MLLSTRKSIIDKENKPFPSYKSIFGWDYICINILNRFLDYYDEITYQLQIRRYTEITSDW